MTCKNVSGDAILHLAGWHNPLGRRRNSKK